MSERFDSVIENKVSPTITQFNWKLVNIDSSAMCELREYESDNLYIRVVNDRGLYDIEVGPVFDKNQLRCVSFFKDWIAPPLKGRWNMSIEEQLSFLVENWNWFNEVFEEKEFRTTISKLDQYLHERM